MTERFSTDCRQTKGFLRIPARGQAATPASPRSPVDRHASSCRSSLRFVPFALPVLVCLAAGACRKESEAPERPVRPVAHAPARPADETRRWLYGTVRAVARSELAFDVPGRVRAMAVDIGDRFSRGQILARLDPRSFRLRVEERRAALREARARATEAEAQLSRIEKIFEAQATTRAEMDRALATANTARARVQRMRAALELARRDQHDALLKAPYDGRVVTRHVEPAHTVQAGQTIFTVQGDGEGLEVRLSIPETWRDRVRLKTRHTIRFPARPHDRAEGILTHVAADAAEGNAYPAAVRLEEAPSSIRPGLTAEVRFDLAESLPDKEGTIPTRVPVSSLVGTAEDQSHVFVIDDEGRVHRTEVHVIDFASGGVVVEGIAPGTSIVTKGAPFLRDGQRVTRLGMGVARYSP